MMRRLQWNGVAGGDGIGNGRNSIFNRFFGTVLLFMVMTGGMFGQVFTETIGTCCSSTNTAIASTTFVNSGYTFTGTADTRTSSPSASYAGASGGRNVFFTASGRTFEIAGVNTVGYTGLQLSFGLNSSGSVVPTLEVSSDGTTYTSLTVSANSTSGWTLRTSTGTIPATSNLRIRFTSNSSTQIRVDDIILAGTLASPSITLADNGTQISATNVTEGTTNHVLHKFQLGVTTANATLTGVGFTTAGGYDATDITNIKLIYSADATLDAGDAILSTLTSPGAAGAKTFSTFTNQVINSGATGYFFITADIANGASSGGNTISLNAITTANLTFSSGTKSGGTTAGGTQTIIASSTPSLLATALTSFGSQCTGGSYGPNTFTITGSSLTTADVTVSSLSGYVFKTAAGLSYTPSLTISQGGGAFSETISVKFEPTSDIGYNGNIVVSGGGASSINVAASGTGTNGTVSVTTVAATGISTTGVSSGGNTISTTCGTISAKGVVWGTPASPTVPSVNSTSNGTGTANYTSSITGLTENTLYNYRAYATNSNDETGYGSNATFTTLSKPATTPTAGTETANGFTASWTAPTGQGSEALTYIVRVYSNNTFTTQVGADIPVSSGTSTVITDLSSSTTYYYQVVVVNAGGTSNTANFSTGVTTLAGPCYTGNAPTFSTSGSTNPGDTDSGGSPTSTIRLATGSVAGSISTTATGVTAGNVTLNFRVKGWSSGETNLTVNLGGQIVNITDLPIAFGWYTLNFTSVAANPTLTFSTVSGKRVHIGNVSIFCTPGCTAPTTSATALTVTNPANSVNSLNVNFTRGNGDGVMIIAKAGATPAAAPTSGTAYALNDAIDGGTVVYKGTASGVNTATIQTIGSLLEGTQYQFSIYEYVGTTTPCYQTTALAGSGTTLYREIDVRGNSVSIVNNDTTPSLADHTDFGSTAVDGGTVTRTFTIHNTGNAFLTLDDMSITLGDFSMTASPSSPINGPGSTTFNITFNPSTFGLRTATITIGSNDADENPYTFTIQGTGVNSNSSDIVADGTFTYTSNINYAAFQSATIPTASDGAAAFRFTIRDGGATATDTDLLGTELTGITFNVANSANIRTARLYDGTTLISSTPTIGATIAFTGLSGTTVTAPANGTKTLTLYVSFNTAVTDNDQLQFTVASATANASGSIFAAANAGGATSSVTGDSNRIEVTADRLVFGTQPASSSINTNLAPFTLRFVDANGNLDFDTNRTVTLTATDGGVNMTAAASYSITAPHTGIVTVSIVQFTSGPQAAITITGTTTGLAFDNDDKSSPFNISAVVYTTNDYRSTSGGTWSTQNAGTATWQTWNGSSWVTSGRPTSTLNNVYIRHTVTSNGNTTVASIIAEGPNASEGTPGGNYTISHASTFSLVEIQSGGVFNCNATGVAFPTTGGSLIVDTGGKLIISAALTSASNFWRGTENFKQGSIVEISDFSGALLANPSQITTNADNYFFGNLTFSGATAITLISTNAANNFNLVENDLTLNNASNNILITSATNKNIVINGNTIVNAGTLRGMSALSSLTLNGNLEIHNGTVNISPTSNGSIVYGIKLKGDLKVFNSSIFTTTDADSELIFEGIGNGLTPETTQNVFASATATVTNVRFKVNADAYVKLDSNITLGSAAAFTVNTGGTLDFGFDSSNNALQILGNAFESQAGSILKVTSPYGLTNIAAGATAGNVQVTAANRVFTALGDFHYIGKNAQATGNALPTNVRNLVVNNEGATNNLTITNANVNVNGALTMTQGNIVSTGANLLSIGANTTTAKGTLSYTKGVVKGTTNGNGVVRRWFSGTNNTDATGLFPLGTTGNQERFITLEYAGGLTTDGYIDAIFTELNMGNAGVTSLSSIPAVGGCPAFTVLNTDANLYWTLTPQAGRFTNGTYKVSLRKESTTSVCKQTVLKRETTNWLNPGTHLAGTDLTAEGDIIARRQGMTGALKDFGLGNGYCSITPVVYNGTWSATPTKNDAVLIEDDYTIVSGNLLVACECVVADNATVTIQKDATFEIINELTVEPGSDLVIEDGGSLVQVTDIINATTNTNSGNIKMHRYTKPMYRYDFTYWSSPVFANNDASDDAASALNGTEFSLKKLSPMTLFDKYFKWNHATQAWLSIAVGAESMVPGRGYIVRAPQFYPVEGSTGNPAPIAYQDGVFIGKPNNGIVQHPVTGGAAKWNLIGNPYPSAISAASFLAANIDDASNPTANKLLDGTLYFWTHNTDIVPIAPGSQIYTYDSGDYASWNGTGSAATTDTSGSLENVPSGFIAAGQSFFVQGTNSGSVLFNNSMRITGNNNQFFRPGAAEPLNNWDTAGKHRVWLNIKGQSKGFCQMLVGYVGEATNGLDRRFDGETFGGNQVLLYSVLEDKKLVIQGRALPFNNQDEVPLGYKSTTNGMLTISIDHFDGLFEGQAIYLEDKVLNIVHDLKASAYNFTTATGTFNERFVLRYLPSEALGNPGHEQIANGLIVYQDNSKIMIKSQFEALEQVTIYDLLGRTIFDKAGIGQNTFSIENVVMNEQPLILKVRLANGQIVNKKIVY